MNTAGFRSSIALACACAAAIAAQAAPPASAPPTSGAPRVADAPEGPLVDACPAQLSVNQTVSAPVATGWTPVNQQGSYPFVRVAFFPGPPGQSGLIVPSVEYKGQAGLHDRWDLPHRDGGYWMTCAYANTTAVLARKLADGTDFCQADYDGHFMTLVVRHWSCGLRRNLAPPQRPRPAAPPLRPTPKAAPRAG